MRLLVAALLLVAPLVTAFYLPGLAPVSFCEESEQTESCKSLIELFVNRLDSVESVLPYEYDAFAVGHRKENLEVFQFFLWAVQQ